MLNIKVESGGVRLVLTILVSLQLLACAGTGSLAESNNRLVLSGAQDRQNNTSPRALSDQASDQLSLPDLSGESDNAGASRDVEQDANQYKGEQEPGALTERVLEEQETAFNPYVLTAHKHNFILPISYSSSINEDAYTRDNVILREGLEAIEVKFQISLKTQLNENDIAFPDDSLSLGITLDAWWQLYSSDISSPFRETNYQPEVFYLVPLLWGPFGGNTALVAGLEHQSNGQVQGLSRSWNRVYGMLIYEKGGFVGSIRPWFRLPEDPKEDPDEANGDDNPDILDFMGHGELRGSWRDSTYEYAAMVRGNPATGKGAVRVGMTFPLFARFRGYVEFFNGYGDSLIDYNHFQRRLGLGVALTNLF